MLLLYLYITVIIIYYTIIIILYIILLYLYYILYSYLLPSSSSLPSQYSFPSHPIIYSSSPNLIFPHHPLIHSILVDTSIYLLIFFFPTFPSLRILMKYSRIPYNHSFPIPSHSNPSFIRYLSILIYYYLYSHHVFISNNLTPHILSEGLVVRVWLR